MQQEEPIYVDERQVSKITGRAIQTLRNDRFHRKGIPYYKLGRSVRYKLDEVYQYCEARKIEIE